MLLILFLARFYNFKINSTKKVKHIFLAIPISFAISSFLNFVNNGFAMYNYNGLS